MTPRASKRLSLAPHETHAARLAGLLRARRIPRPGVRVVDVPRRSPAGRAGLRAGDRILAVDGVPAEDCLDVLFAAADESFAVTFQRRGRARTTLVSRREGEAHGLVLEDPPLRLCANKCPFCYVDQSPPHARFRPGLNVYDDDYRHSFLHGYYVTLTNLAERDIARILAMRLSPLYVSVHATDPALRSRLLGRPKVAILPILERFAAGGIEVHTQVVLVPGVNDGAALERTVADLRALSRTVKTVAVVPVGVTAWKNPAIGSWTPETAAEALVGILRLGRRHPRGFVQAADEWFCLASLDPPPRSYYGGMAVEENGVGMVRRLLDEWAGASLPKRVSPRSALVISGRSPEPFLRRIVNRLNRVEGMDVEYRVAENRTFGPDVTVTGLLAWRDIAPVIKASEKPVVYLPDVMLNAEDRFLDNVTLAAARKKSGRDLRVVSATATGFLEMISS